MTDKDRNPLLVQALERVCADIAAIAALLEDDKPRGEPAAESAPAAEKECTYEEARAILAEKARAGFRSEVKAILTKHGLNQLSDVTDPKEYAAIVAEAEAIAMPRS